ncbi:flotillin family protein [Labilibacter marinus]|uniref:flotillin family protein n=1 Tax=Labilibacter marinus TaxID=1477105 RepID=UPI00094F9885|nr:flotillin [Labilibacter marinus]
MFEGLSGLPTIIIVAICVILFGFIILVIKTYRKATQGQSLVRTGQGGVKVSFGGMFVIPVLHQMELMDITLKTVTIARQGKEGLICKDNLRADIKVNFFVRVNKTSEDVIQVAQAIGCDRASDKESLVDLFDAKFSEALKTVGKQFDFVELYNSREQFKLEILRTIGTDLNGYVLDDCAIDYLEQTSIDVLSPDNILDVEGIKKITKITAEQQILSNQIRRDKEKTVTKQDVEAKETVLQLEKQLAETEEKQKREIANIKSREEAEIFKVEQEQKLISENARLATEEEVQVAEENKERQVIVARKNKERTEAIENEAVLKDQQIEENERERLVSMARLDKDKALEGEQKKMQEVIRERVEVEKSVVIEEEKIKDTKAHAEAERNKLVAIKDAEKEAETNLVTEIKSAEAHRKAAEFQTEQRIMEAKAAEEAADKEANATKILAEAKAAEAAALGISEAQVIEAKAEAKEKEGMVDAKLILEKSKAQAESIKETGLAEATVVEAKADAAEKEGMAVNRVDSEKYTVEAKGIEEKAAAMKKLDGVGKEHEEFKLKLDKDKEIQLAKINIQKDIAESQAKVISEALKAANIDIVGGETMFFEQIMGAISNGKSVDKVVNNSEVLKQVKDTFFSTEDGQSFKDNMSSFINQFGVSSDDLKNLTISNLLFKIGNLANNESDKSSIFNLLDIAKSMGLSNKSASDIGIDPF